MNEDEFMRIAEEIAYKTARNEEAKKALSEEMWLEFGKQLYMVFSNFQKAGFSEYQALNLTADVMNILLASCNTKGDTKE